ncbi:hypothetical protein MKY88_17400 [Lysinibacillus sp. FSL R7-0073]|uniref:hypothetical protein n=1 Tax=Lysinibacillus sp. FSL R7-0073 TaxID=2921669 RepID=UPI0030F5B19D
MSNKEVKVTIEGPASHTLFELESDGEQGIIHVVLRDMDSNFKEVGVVGVILSPDELQEIYYAIVDILKHQERESK